MCKRRGRHDWVRRLVDREAEGKGKVPQQERVYRDELDTPALSKDGGVEERATRASRKAKANVLA